VSESNRHPGRIRNFSFVVTLSVSIIALGYRINYSVYNEKPLQLTTWDALGYYYTLPGIFIYDDIRKVEWFEEMEQKYNLSGGQNYQLMDLENGNRAGKYFNGIALMELPFFLIGHTYANSSEYPADGFSAPYQYSLAFGVVLYFILALFLLRKILLRFYDDVSVGICLLIITLGTNLLQYVSVDGAMSHSFIFLLYVLLLHFTIKWHDRPGFLSASMIGLVIGLAVWCRPTEGLMIFIPILWNITNKESRRQKWKLILKHKSHILLAVLLGVIAILPQLIYWKYVTDSYLFNVGSKWTFLNPWWRVLFGFEKGWFVYTPVTVSFIIGLWYARKYPFGKAIAWFSLLNIWIVISWWDWKYGGSYSTRSLVQAYPIFALALCALLTIITPLRLKIGLGLVVIYLVCVNLFQIYQYNKGTLSGTDMNRLYYSAIYLDPNPSPLDMSLLDTQDYPDESDFSSRSKIDIEFEEIQSCSRDSAALIFEISKDIHYPSWFHIKATIVAESGYFDSFLTARYVLEDTTISSSFRLANPISSYNEMNDYEFFYRVPKHVRTDRFQLIIETRSKFQGFLKSLDIALLQ
jgi:hypothetical protein